MKIPLELRWRVRLAADLVLLLVVVFVLDRQGAPAWATTLAVVVVTRASQLGVAIDLAALQSTVRAIERADAPREPK